MKGKVEVAPSGARDVQYYKCKGYGHYCNYCPTKKVMIIRPNGEVISEDESEGEQEN